MRARGHRSAGASRGWTRVGWNRAVNRARARRWHRPVRARCPLRRQRERAVDAELFDLVGGGAQARRVDHVQHQPADVDAALDPVSRGSRMGVTIATSCPASALSRLDLPTLGARPARPAGRRAAPRPDARGASPRRPSAEGWRPARARPALRALPGPPPGNPASPRSARGPVSAARPVAPAPPRTRRPGCGWRCERPPPCLRRSGRRRFRLRQVDTVVQEGAQREFARFGQSAPMLNTARQRACEHRAQRPPCACS